MLDELSRSEGKQVDLVLRGETTSVDRKIADDLAEPLVHLVRNAFDHGIEPMAERETKGKAPRGSIHLGAYHEGNQLVIDVQG